MMDDAKNTYKVPTPQDSLESQIMDPNFPKNEREWWAAAEITRLRAGVEALEAVNAALASWHGAFTDGTTGLYHDGCGNAQCARDHLVVHLTAEVEALRADAAKLRTLLAVVPLPPETISLEFGWAILNVIQAVAAERAAQGERG